MLHHEFSSNNVCHSPHGHLCVTLVSMKLPQLGEMVLLVITA